MSILLKLLYLFSKILIKIKCFISLDKLILQFTWKSKGPIGTEFKEQGKGTCPTNIKIFYKFISLYKLWPGT